MFGFVFIMCVESNVFVCFLMVFLNWFFFDCGLLIGFDVWYFIWFVMRFGICYFLLVELFVFYCCYVVVVCRFWLVVCIKEILVVVFIVFLVCSVKFIFLFFVDCGVCIIVVVNLVFYERSIFDGIFFEYYYLIIFKIL